MPFDGTDFQPLGRLHMSPEEKALRCADEFFTDESRWEQSNWKGVGPNGSYCVGRTLIKYSTTCNVHRALGLPRGDSWSRWNDTLPDFATMKAHLRTRIKYYEDKRLGVQA